MDIIYLGAVLFSVVIVLVIASYVFSQVQAGILASPMSGSIEVNQSLGISDTAIGGFDAVGLGAFVCLLIATLLLMVYIPANPIYIPIFIILAIITIVVSVALSNLWAQLEATAVISTTMASFPMSSFIFNNLPIITSAIIGLGLIITYAKGSYGGANNVH